MSDRYRSWLDTFNQHETTQALLPNPVRAILAQHAPAGGVLAAVAEHIALPSTQPLNPPAPDARFVHLDVFTLPPHNWDAFESAVVRPFETTHPAIRAHILNALGQSPVTAEASISGPKLNDAPADDGDPSGQLWIAFGGVGSGNSDGHSDFRIEHADNDALAASQIIAQEQAATGIYQAVGLDTAASLFFSLDPAFHLRVTNINTGVDLTNTVVASTSDQDVMNAFAIDVRNHVIFADLFGGDYLTIDPGHVRAHGGDLIKITYNPTTGAIVNPYNPTTFAIDTTKILINSDSTNKVYANGRAFYLSLDGSSLYYVDDNNNDPGGFWGFSTNGVFKVSTTGSVGTNNAPTPTLLSSQVQFPINDANGYITGVTVNEAKNVIYFTTNSSAEGVNVTQNAIWWMPIAGGTATKMVVPAGVSVSFPTFYGNSLELDQVSQKLYYSDKQTGKIVQFTLAADGKSLTSGINFATLNSAGGSLGANGAFANDMAFDHLPAEGNVLGTAAYIQYGGTAVTLLTATPTISDIDGPNLAGLSIRVVGGHLGNGSAFGVLSGSLTGSAGQIGDQLFVNGQQSGAVSGATVSWNAATQTLTLSGNIASDTYKALFPLVSFQETGTDNTNGFHPDRVIDFVSNDGVNIVTPTTADPNHKQITIVLNRAPVLAVDTYQPQEGGSSTGTGGFAGTGVFANDVERDGDTVTLTKVNGSALNVGVVLTGTYGHATINSNGSFTYNADNIAAIDGATLGSHPTDSFTYTVDDGLGGVSTQTVNFAVNRPPVASADSYNVIATLNVSGTAGTGGTGVFGNDSDNDGDTLVVSALNGSGANVGTSFAGTYGHLNLAANGSFTYNADNAAAINSVTGSHPVDSFTYTLSDGHGGSVNQTVTFTVDRLPALGTDSYSLLEGAKVIATGGLAGTGALGNDTDQDADALIVTALNGSGANLNTLFAGTYGHLNLKANGAFTYKADDLAAIDGAPYGANPIDTFTYTVSDGFGGIVTQNLSFTIDRPPLALSDTINVDENTTGSAATLATGLLGNDLDPDTNDNSTLVITAVNGSGAAVGTQIVLASGALLTVNADGTYTYDPNHAFDDLAGAASGAANTSATDDFTYTDNSLSAVVVHVNITGIDSDDHLLGTPGNDTLDGGVGDDLINGRPGNDNIMGNVGDDTIIGRAGDDTIDGGTGEDEIDGAGGNDIIHGGDDNDVVSAGKGVDQVYGDNGDDTLQFGNRLRFNDLADGGSGNDQLILSGDYSFGVVLAAGTLVSIETVKLKDGFSYDLKFADGNVASGVLEVVTGVDLTGTNSFTFDGGNETDGRFRLIGGAGDDHLTGSLNVDIIQGGAGGDVLEGNAGGDDIVGGGGSDTFFYHDVADSIDTAFDFLKDLDLDTDKIHTWFNVVGVDATQTASSIAALGTVFDAAHLGVRHAALANVGAHTYLLVDANGTAGYQSGQDLMIKVDGMTGTLQTSDFV